MFLLAANCVNKLEEIITIWIFLCGNSTSPLEDYSWMLGGSSWLPFLFEHPLWLLNEMNLMLESRAQQQGVGGRCRTLAVLACVAMTTGSADKPAARWPWMRHGFFSPCFGRWSQIDCGRWKQTNQPAMWKSADLHCGSDFKRKSFFLRVFSTLYCVTEAGSF